jgi:hypothetical protein
MDTLLRSWYVFEGTRTGDGCLAAETRSPAYRIGWHNFKEKPPGYAGISPMLLLLVYMFETCR